MKQLLLSVFLLAVVVSFVNAANGSSEEEITQVQTPQRVVVSDPVVIEDVSAEAYGVFDLETGELLFSQREDVALPIASVTKLFTAASVLSSPESESVIEITTADVATEGRAGKLVAGQLYTLHELLFPLLLESSNDAATALERKLGKIPFANRTLADGSGLSSDNTATVEELAREMSRVYKTLPHVFDVTMLDQYVGEYTGWVNNSPVSSLSGYRGGKHGYTEAAGRTLAAVFAEPDLQGREIGYIILGSKDVKRDVQALRKNLQHSVHLEPAE